MLLRIQAQTPGVVISGGQLEYGAAPIGQVLCDAINSFASLPG